MLTTSRGPFAALILLTLLLTATVAAAEPLTYLAGRLDEAQLVELRVAAPDVRFLVGLTGEEALAVAGEIDGADAHVLDDAFLAAAVNLRFVQSWSAGVDGYLKLDGLRESETIVLANMQGVHGPAIAEHVFATLLALTRDLPEYLDAQKEANWDRGAGSNMIALSGRTMFVVGMGGIGKEIARRADAFDMRVLATVRTAREAPAYVDELGTAADLDRFLARADVVAIALPLTDETRGLFDAGRFALMKDGAYLVNIGRGPIVDTDALLAALQDGKLAGAALDVTDPEPLPAEHPLWQQDNVIITPHVASRAELTIERRWAIFRENMRRFAAGETPLNVVDKQLGY